MSKYQQLIIDKTANTGKYNAHVFAHLCLHSPKKYIQGNTYQIISEHALTGSGKVSARYEEKHARIATLTLLRLAQISEGMAWMALGVSRQAAIMQLTEAYSRVIREDVQQATFCFMVLETVETTQADTTIHNNATPQAASTAPASVTEPQLETNGMS